MRWWVRSLCRSLFLLLLVSDPGGRVLLVGRGAAAFGIVPASSSPSSSVPGGEDPKGSSSPSHHSFPNEVNRHGDDDDCNDDVRQRVRLLRESAAGIWRFVRSSRNDGRDEVASTAKATAPVLLNLRDDGTFRQCNEGYVEGRWMKGVWSILSRYEVLSFVNETETAVGTDDDSSFKTPRIYLAMDRQYYGPPVDALFEGSFPPEAIAGPTDADGVMHVTGRVRKGRFALPKTHPDFFVRAVTGTLLTNPSRGAASEYSGVDTGESCSSFNLTQIVSAKSLSDRSRDSSSFRTSASEGDNNAFQFQLLPPPRFGGNPRFPL